MAYILRGLRGVIQIKDDIVVHGQGQEHDDNLRALLKRLYEYGIRLRKEKCSFGQQSIMWFGHIFSKQGMSPDPEKVRHIKAWPAPKNKDEVKSFLQTVQFVAAYMRSEKGTPHADVTAPLRKLTHKHVRFEWTEECQRAFTELKNRLSDKTVLVPYVPHLPTRLYVDHGPEGIASTVAQLHKEGNNPGWKAVHHKSPSLIPAEQNYTKPEGESLAIYSGIKLNQQYLYGTPFTVMTDHSALPSLYNTNRQAPTRVERHKGRLGSFQFQVQHVPGNKHPCDYGSRHPDPIPENLTKEQMEDLGIKTEETDQEIWVSRIVNTAIPAITLDAMKGATATDPELAKILEEKRAAKKSSATSKGPWGKIWDEVRERDGILLRKDREDGQDRLVIPKALQAQAIAIAHEGHQQTDGTLRMLRQTQWFRNMRQAVKEYVESCKYQTANPTNPTLPMKLNPLPQAPWKITAVDYKGPIGTGRNKVYLHTQMDAYSRYPVVHLLKSTKITELKKALGQTIRTHRCPDKIWSDGGPPYNSHEWVQWCEGMGRQTQENDAVPPPSQRHARTV